jgi:hypothetical protein
MIPWKLDGARRALELYYMRKSSAIRHWRNESACSTLAAYFVEVIEDQYGGAMPPCEYEESVPRVSVSLNASGEKWM